MLLDVFFQVFAGCLDTASEGAQRLRVEVISVYLFHFIDTSHYSNQQCDSGVGKTTQWFYQVGKILSRNN